MLRNLGNGHISPDLLYSKVKHKKLLQKMPGISPKAIVVDGRGHLMGRLSSIVAKLILTGNKVVVVR